MVQYIIGIFLYIIAIPLFVTAAVFIILQFNIIQKFKSLPWLWGYILFFLLLAHYAEYDYLQFQNNPQNYPDLTDSNDGGEMGVLLLRLWFIPSLIFGGITRTFCLYLKKRGKPDSIIIKITDFGFVFLILFVSIVIYSLN
jgi:hypothetical protein